MQKSKKLKELPKTILQRRIDKILANSYEFADKALERVMIGGDDHQAIRYKPIYDKSGNKHIKGTVFSGEAQLHMIDGKIWKYEFSSPELSDEMEFTSILKFTSYVLKQTIR